MTGEPSSQSRLEKRDLLDLLVSQLKDFVIVLTDARGNFTSWHPGVEQHFGYRPEEFVGENAAILFLPEDRENGVAEREFKSAAEHGWASDTRWLMRKNGQRIFVEGVTLGLRDAAGDLAGFGKILRDITEIKKTEDSLRDFTRALDQSTVIVRDWDGRITHWTAGCETLYGWTAEKAVGQLCHELLQTKFPVPMSEIQQQLLSSKSWRGELDNAKRDRARVAVSAFLVLLSDERDQPVSVIETQTDITARLAIQQELQHANEQLKRMALELERSNEELEEFARIASHDLSAPITSTRWLVELLMSRHAQQLDENGRDCLRQVLVALQRMSDLVEAVLAHARVGTSAITSATATEAEDAFLVAVQNLQKDIVTSGAVIEHDSLPQLHIDSQALTQLFQNLLSNAIKYRREVPPLIKVSARPQESMWLLSVQDNGIGIEPVWHERIFQPMQRCHGADIAGSGIGLATCKKIVTRAGGQIWVESQVGSGSTFFFTLPGPSESMNPAMTPRQLGERIPGEA